LAWLFVAYVLPVNRVIYPWPPWNRIGVALLLAAVASVAIWTTLSRRHWSFAVLCAALIAPFLLIPTWGRMQNYAPLHNPELAQLSGWARVSTPKDAVFLFPDADQDLYPGVFRAEALRTVYVDWKTGGQVNFFRGMGQEWWARWQRTMGAPFDPNHLPDYRQLGIDYVVLRAKNRLPAEVPAYQNSQFAVYGVSALTPQ
jgi:hypothetical protein